jgi:hypothetical protein
MFKWHTYCYYSNNIESPFSGPETMERDCFEKTMKTIEEVFGK